MFETNVVSPFQGILKSRPGGPTATLRGYRRFALPWADMLWPVLGENLSRGYIVWARTQPRSVAK